MLFGTLELFLFFCCLLHSVKLPFTGCLMASSVLAFPTHWAYFLVQRVWHVPVWHLQPHCSHSGQMRTNALFSNLPFYSYVPFVVTLQIKIVTISSQNSALGFYVLTLVAELSRESDVNPPTGWMIAGIYGYNRCSRAEYVIVWRSCLLSKMYVKLILLEALKSLQLSDKDGKQSVCPHDGRHGYKY